MLSSLNCLLLAHQVGMVSAEMRIKVESIIPNKFWLDKNKFDAFKVENGNVDRIVDDKTNLISADKIDDVSEEIDEIFDKLLELQYQ